MHAAAQYLINIYNKDLVKMKNRLARNAQCLAFLSDRDSVPLFNMLRLFEESMRCNYKSNARLKLIKNCLRFTIGKKRTNALSLTCIKSDDL